LWLSVALAAFAVSVSVGLADSPTSPPMQTQSSGPKATEAVGDEIVAAARQATALGAQQILSCLKVWKDREPKPTESWAEKMGPGNPVAAPTTDWKMPDGTLNPALGGVHPTELAERLHELAFTGRMSKGIYDFFRGKIITIPLGLHAIPEDTNASRTTCAFLTEHILIQGPMQCPGIFCQGSTTF
jgi:hypothetical protein